MKWIFHFLCLSFSLSVADGKVKTHKPPKIKEEDDVLVLTDSNFARALQENKYLLVKFYVALSGPSQTVKEEFSVAAGKLKKELQEIKFGQVEITQEKDLGKEFKIKEFPTIKLFVNGDRENPTDCKGVRTASSFITWLNRRIGPSAVYINTTDHYDSFVQSDNVTVVGFFKEKGNKKEYFFDAAKDIPEFAFGLVTNEDVFSHAGKTANIVTVYKKDKTASYVIKEDEFESKLDLVRLIRTYIMDLVTEYNLETQVTIFDVPTDSHILLFASKTSESFTTVYENFESAALEFRGKLVFILVDTNETRNGRIFEYFRITEVDTPAVRIMNLTTDMKYRMPADEVSFKNVRSFCQNYLDGKAKPKRESEEICKDWEKKPVKRLVGKNFNTVAYNKTSNTFVMFYAPWSKECKKLFPVWEELGRRYQNHTNVIIAKIDCTANDIQLMVLERYPYFRFFPAGSDTQAIRYTGERTLEAFTEYLEDNLKQEENQSSRETPDENKNGKEAKDEL
ncbi:hypothetical protein GDO86_017403 [Hymenochirus boettgeri]|uniref:protein disulfide-isomerase n=1 Tax=Hymenochirus boettgeri TaxID=247094 RepID=A0A8T2IMT8_9PIPI|nr:hypothetical protein GDO86_017403 [Hymenochirus boettgeri]